MAGPYATLYWAQFLEMDSCTINLGSVFKYFSIDKYVCDKKSVPKQLLRLKGCHIQDDASVRTMP